MGINERFIGDSPAIPGVNAVVPQIVAQSTTQTSQAGAAASDVTGSKVVIPKGHFGAGVTFRYTLSGVLAGGNAKMKIHLYVGATAVLSIESDAVTAGDWMAQMTVCSKGISSQACFGFHTVTTQDTVVDFAAATADTTGDVIIKAVIEGQNAGDTVTADYVLVEYWKK